MEVWEELIEEADRDTDGTIDYEEFKKLMYKLLSKNSSLSSQSLSFN